ANLNSVVLVRFFFFQAEDGIRDFHVTGVQTCALPILSAEALNPWGNWEDFISQSGVSDTGTLATLTQWRLDTTGQGRTHMTREIIFPSTLHLPFIHYLPGDYIQAPGAGGQVGELRVHPATLQS